MDVRTVVQSAREFDAARPSAPGEHWLVFGVGLGLLVWAGSRRSRLTRSLLRAVGTGLLARAASGRDGLRAAAR